MVHRHDLRLAYEMALIWALPLTKPPPWIKTMTGAGAGSPGGTNTLT
jgi:hypothetical protein